VKGKLANGVGSQ